MTIFQGRHFSFDSKLSLIYLYFVTLVEVNVWIIAWKTLSLNKY